MISLPNNSAHTPYIMRARTFPSHGADDNLESSNAQRTHISDMHSHFKTQVCAANTHYRIVQHIHTHTQHTHTRKCTHTRTHTQTKTPQFPKMHKISTLQSPHTHICSGEPCNRHMQKTFHTWKCPHAYTHIWKCPPTHPHLQW